MIRDKVDLTALGDIFDDFSDVVGNMTQFNDDVVLTLDGSSTLIFIDTDLNDFQAQDFILAP
jgi:hypothetical protein